MTLPHGLIVTYGVLGVSHRMAMWDGILRRWHPLTFEVDIGEPATIKGVEEMVMTRALVVDQPVEPDVARRILGNMSIDVEVEAEVTLPREHWPRPIPFIAPPVGNLVYLGDEHTADGRVVRWYRFPTRREMAVIRKRRTMLRWRKQRACRHRGQGPRHRIAGTHPGIMVVDDPHSGKAPTEEQRRATEAWFHEVIRQNGSTVVVTGSFRVHEDVLDYLFPGCIKKDE